jgi:GxxExxY protein
MLLARDSTRDRCLLCVKAMLIEAAFNPTTKRIIDAAVEVHRHIGPGLLESTYLECLESEFADRGLRFERERAVPIVYKGKRLRKTYKLDLVIEDLVVVEVKSVAAILGIHEAQVITYLKLTGHPVGLLIKLQRRKVDGRRPPFGESQGAV